MNQSLPTESKPAPLVFGAYLLGLHEDGGTIQYQLNVSIPRTENPYLARDTVARLAEDATGLRFDFVSWRPFPDAWTINAGGVQ